jgi:hypothetical protein
MRVVPSLLLVLVMVTFAVAQGSLFPSSVVTNQDKIEWLTTEADAAAGSVDAEAERPLPEQREAVYGAALTRATDLLRLSETLAGRLPRLEGRLNETIAKALLGLERIANERLTIGMTAEQVRQIRGEPAHVSETTTADGVREQWRYGRTVLSFDNGKLVEIRQTLKTD